MSDEEIAVIDQLEAEVKILTAERDVARQELAQAHANIDQLLAELKRRE